MKEDSPLQAVLGIGDELRLLANRLDELGRNREQKAFRPVAEISEAIHHSRKDQGLTLRGLAALAEISVATLQKIENGDLSISVKILHRTANALGLSLWIG